jgi:hypothetical protein
MQRSTRSLIRVAGGLVLAAVMTACGGTAASSQPASVAPSAPPTAAASASPSDALPSPSPSLSQAIATPDAASSLVEMLPADLGGVATQKLEVLGSDTSMFDASTAIIFESILTILQAKGNDMAIGIASTSGASIVAIRVSGESAKDVGEAMISSRALNATTTKEELDIAGKHVIKVTTTTTRVPFYVYAAGDVSFTIAASDETLVAEALSKLP